MNFEVVFSEIPAVAILAKEGNAESLKSDVKTARVLHFRVLAGSRNYGVAILDTVVYNTGYWWILEVSVSLSLSFSLAAFRAFRSCNKSKSSKLLQSASRASRANASGLPINKFPRGDFGVAYFARVPLC